MHRTSRRSFLARKTGEGAPEVTDVRFGALTDCSPIVIAHERGLFKKHGINATIAKGASWAWFLSQFRRWGFIDAGLDYQATAPRVMRTDLYEEAMKEIGVLHGGRDDMPETLFDGKVFDPSKPEEYALFFDVKAVKS
jgi:hypothetical protein